MNDNQPTLTTDDRHRCRDRDRNAMSPTLVEALNWLAWARQIATTIGIVLIAFLLFVRSSGVDAELPIAGGWWWWLVPATLPHSWFGLLLPTVLFASGVFAFRQRFALPTTSSRQLLSVALIFLGFRYVVWRGTSTLALDSFANGAFSFILFGAELFAFINTVAFFLIAIPSSDRSAEADALEVAVEKGEFLPWVDVLVPTYNEPVEVLRRTIIGCQAMEYPNKRIYLLDDSRRPHVRRLAEELGCFYFDRPDNSHAKAGNINHALPQVGGELVAFFDADFVPARNFLTRTVAFFQDENVALLQTPQHFFNEDPIAIDLGLQGTLTDEQALFYRHIQPSRDATNAIVCCGSCYVIRRPALDEIGGIPTESLTEDFLTSVKLQALGYQTKYLNEALSAGLAPEDISAYTNQRLRWCRGTLQSLFCKVNPLSVPGLDWVQRVTHAFGFVYWFLAFPRLIFLAAPLVYLFLGWVPIEATVEGIVYFYVPFYICNVLAFSWLNGGRRSAFWSDVYETLLCFPMAVTVVQTLIKPFGKPFKVTPKGVSSDRVRLNWQFTLPLYAIVVLSFIGVAKMSVATRSGASDFSSLWIIWVFVSYNLTLATVACLAAIDLPKPKHIGFDRRVACQLHGDDRLLVAGETLELSEGDAVVAIAASARGDLPASLRLHLLDLGAEFGGERTLEARVKWQVPGDRDSILLGLEFVHLDLEQQRFLVEFLYCQPGQWEDRRTPELTSAWALFKAVYSFYPLAMWWQQERDRFSLSGLGEQLRLSWSNWKQSSSPSE